MTTHAAASGWSALKARALTLLGRGAANETRVPVRDWISVSAGRPTRLLGFDQTLVWVVVALGFLGRRGGVDHDRASVKSTSPAGRIRVRGAQAGRTSRTQIARHSAAQMAASAPPRSRVKAAIAGESSP